MITLTIEDLAKFFDYNNMIDVDYLISKARSRASSKCFETPNCDNCIGENQKDCYYILCAQELETILKEKFNEKN